MRAQQRQPHQRVPDVVETPFGFFARKVDEDPWSSNPHHLEQLKDQVSFYNFTHQPTQYMIPSHEARVDCFLGHIPYWITPELVREVFLAVRRVRIGRVDMNKKDGVSTGCGFVEVAEADVESFLSLEKCILFDFQGVWFAEDQTQKAALDNYVLSMREQAPWLRHPQLPYMASSCERKSSRRENHHDNNAVPQQQQQPPAYASPNAARAPLPV